MKARADVIKGARTRLVEILHSNDQYFALVIEQTHSHVLTALMEFELICEPSEIKDFKLYGSVDNTSWTELHNETNATIENTGTEYTITNTNNYQHYGLVVTKTNNNHNVMLSEMTIGVEEQFFTNPPCLAKGTWIKPVDSANNGLVVGALSSSFNVSSISQLSTGIIARYGVNHRYFSFEVTFTTELSNTNYQVILTELYRASGIGLIFQYNMSVLGRTSTIFTGFVYV